MGPAKTPGSQWENDLLKKKGTFPGEGFRPGILIQEVWGWRIR